MIGKTSAQPHRPLCPHTAATARPERFEHGAQCLLGFGHIHEAERTQGGVERTFRANRRFRIAPHETQFSSPLSSRKKSARRIFGDIVASHRTFRPDGLARPERYQAVAAGDVQHLLPGLQVRQFQEPCLYRFELSLPVVRILLAGAVPAITLNALLQARFH